MSRSPQAFQLSLPGFDGPVDALPPLVAARQMALDELKLAAIPPQFLAASAEGIDLEAAGEVLSAVAGLLLMKSRALLAEPAAEADEEVTGPVRERADRAPIRAAALDLRARQGMESFPSPGRPSLLPRRVEPRPPLSLTQAWEAMRAREGTPLHAAVPTFVRLEVAISRILAGLRRGRALSLRSLLRGATRRDAVTHFLAMLELARRGEIAMAQDGLFQDITVEPVAEDAERGSRAG